MRNAILSFPQESYNNFHDKFKQMYKRWGWMCKRRVLACERCFCLMQNRANYMLSLDIYYLRHG